MRSIFRTSALAAAACALISFVAPSSFAPVSAANAQDALVGGLIGGALGAGIGGAVSGSAGGALAGGILGGATGAIIGDQAQRRRNGYYAYRRGCYEKVGYHRYRRLPARYCY